MKTSAHWAPIMNLKTILFEQNQSDFVDNNKSNGGNGNVSTMDFGKQGKL